jgi:5'-deoxynucleotidase YfbR-like HD superfamily hydrolase
MEKQDYAMTTDTFEEEEVKEHLKILSGGSVKRYHTLPTIGEQSVASHSWGVTLILQWLYPNISKIALVKALTHDVIEKQTGDMPSPTKWNNPALAKEIAEVEKRVEKELGVDYPISDEEKMYCKHADLFELLLYCHNQRSLGNTNVTAVFSNGVEKLSEMKLNKKGTALLAYLVSTYGVSQL